MLPTRLVKVASAIRDHATLPTLVPSRLKWLDVLCRGRKMEDWTVVLVDGESNEVECATSVQHAE